MKKPKDYRKAHEQARINAIKTLGLHEKNTAQDRAKAMGFDLEGFHGMPSEIRGESFDTNSIAKNDYGSIGQGVYIDPSKDASYANAIINLLGNKQGSNVLPVKIKTGNMMSADELPHINSAERSKAVTEGLKKRGIHSVMSKVNGKPNEVMVINPAHIRSRFAAFDPHRAHENDLLAAKGGSVKKTIDEMKAALKKADGGNVKGGLSTISDSIRDAVQAASNSAASNVSVPIDVMSYALRKAGIPIPQNAVLGSDWMKQHRLTQDVQSPVANAVGESIGNVLPIAAATKAPQIAAGLLKVGENAAARTPMNTATGNQAGAIVYHGSPHKFPATEKNPLGEFDASKMGTGEGAQAYGVGHYTAEAQATAQSYKDTLRGLRTNTQSVVRDLMPDRHFTTKERAEIFRAAIDDGTPVDRAARQLANRQASIRDVPNDILLEAVKRVREDAQGYLYKIDLPDDQIAKMLDWDKPLSEQSKAVQKAFEPYVAPIRQSMAQKAGSEWGDLAAPQAYDPTGKELLGLLRQGRDNMTASSVLSGGVGPEVSAALRAQGIPGIRYLDGGSRGAGSGSSNFVVFPGNEHMLKIIGREKAGGTIHAADGGSIQGKAMPTIAQMKMALSRAPDLRNMGVNQAIGSRAYSNPDPKDNGLPPVGGVSDQNGLPVGGVDTDSTVPGQQMTPQAPNQPTQPFPPAQGGMQPPMTVGIQQQPPQMGNMLSMTPQGQTLDALAPAGMPGKAEGGSMPVYTHHVVDPQDNHRIMGKYQSASTARKARDRLDNQYGSYRYKVTMIPQAKEAVREVLKKGGQVNKDMMKLELSKKKVK